MIWGSLAPNLSKKTINHRIQADQELRDFHLVTKAQVLQPNSSAWDKTHQPNQQVSKLVFLVGFARRGAAIVYPKNAREPHEKILWFFFLGMETHCVN